jgi:hypothetical protein
MRFTGASSVLPGRLSFHQQFFQHLGRPADPQHRFAQVCPLPLYFFELGLTRFEFLPQCIKPSLQLFSHGFLFPNRKSEDGFAAHRHIRFYNPLLLNEVANRYG